MTLLDVVLCVALAARIHGTDAAVRSTVKRAAKRVPRSLHGAIRLISDSRSPMQVVERLMEELE